MTKIFLFDIDGTIAEENKSISNDFIDLLKELTNIAKVAFISGKPSSYIIGMLRQIECNNQISIIGENGATINIGSNMPPKDYFKFDIDVDTEINLQTLKKNLIEKYGNNIWFQPNEINLTVFPKNLEVIDEIYEIFFKYKTEEMIVYKHVDSIEMVPKMINKKDSIFEFLKILNLDRQSCEIHVFGDNKNDLPMFEIADFVYVVGKKIQYDKAYKTVNNTLELSVVLEEILYKKVLC